MGFCKKEDHEKPKDSLEVQRWLEFAQEIINNLSDFYKSKK